MEHHHEHQMHVSKGKLWGGILLSLLGLSIGIAISIIAWLTIT